MKYKLKNDSAIDYINFKVTLESIRLINVIIDRDRVGMVITPSNELVNLINDNCIGGETNTFKDAMLKMFNLIGFEIDKYYLEPVVNFEAFIENVYDDFSRCEHEYNMMNRVNIRRELLSLLFEDDSKFDLPVIIFDGYM